MESFADKNKNALALNESFNREISDICEPLFSSFGLNTFFFEIFGNGSDYFTIGNRLDWYSKFFSDEGHLDQFHFGHGMPADRDEFRVVWDLLPTNRLLQTMKSAQIAHGFSVYRRKGDQVYAYHFAAPAENSSVNSLYLNEFDLFDRFIYYFHQKAAHIISLGDSATHHAFLRSKSSPGDISATSEFDHPERRQTFIDSLQVKKHRTTLTNGKLVKVTDKQARCVHLLSKGMTVKQIAPLLNLSPRTVTQYLGAVKSKTGLFERSELVSFFEANGLGEWYQPLI